MKGRVCSRDREGGGESTICLRPFLPNFPVRVFAVVLDRRERGTFFCRRTVGPTTCQCPRDGALWTPPEGCTSNPLPFHAEVSSFFLPLLDIATELRVRGSSPLMFILLLSTICVENVHNPFLSLFRQF